MSDVHFARAMRRIHSLSPRKLRTHKLTCCCQGWWFPHRIGSRASFEVQVTHGTQGCFYSKRVDLTESRQ